ncbi:hypothetical protein [Butyrivibrio sp. AC2005]|uniref:hypothetical protein n=1 Tax=Butyrivibrio sp. AC2005 TaxID=1280672 RepID=UPI00040DDF22|nr:hypothetical protein [Butyrivibrio sp. AC2005]
MKKRTKFIFGGLLLAFFAIAVTILIIRNNEKVKASEDTIEQYDEEAAPEEEKTEETLMFPDKRNFTEEELARDAESEPEGSDHYEVDEEPPLYHVFINNYEEIFTHYDDFKICNELPYYLHTYFNLCTGNLSEMYEVTITEGSFKGDEYTSLITFEATVDKYPDMIIYIEYDKNYRAFGIKSLLGDYSLDALKKKGKDRDFWIEYDPSLEQEEDDNTAPDAIAIDTD